MLDLDVLCRPWAVLQFCQMVAAVKLKELREKLVTFGLEL